MDIGAAPMDISETPMALAEPPMRFGEAPMLFGEPRRRHEALELCAIQERFERADFFGTIEQMTNLVKTRLDRERHTRQQIAIETQITVTRSLAAHTTRGVSGAIAQVFHIVHVETEQVSDAVRKEQRGCAELE